MQNREEKQFLLSYYTSSVGCRRAHKRRSLASNCAKPQRLFLLYNSTIIHSNTWRLNADNTAYTLRCRATNVRTCCAKK